MKCNAKKIILIFLSFSYEKKFVKNKFWIFKTILKLALFFASQMKQKLSTGLIN